MVQQLVAGIQRFKKDVFPQYRELFEELAEGQEPKTLFITCSDSRIDPNLITQTKPGDLFVIRNAGNLVPAYGTTSGGEVASIEFAIMALGVRYRRLRALAMRRDERRAKAWIGYRDACRGGLAQTC